MAVEKGILNSVFLYEILQLRNDCRKSHRDILEAVGVDSRFEMPPTFHVTLGTENPEYRTKGPPQQK
jgi:hypothetical protein